MKLIDRFIAFTNRWQKAISWVSIGWFTLTCAAAARFIELPKIELLTDRNATIASGMWNALWWGFIRPLIERRKATLATTDLQNG